jgi:hypothetical protein
MDVKGLVVVLPSDSDRMFELEIPWARAMYACANLKELVMLSEEQNPSIHISIPLSWMSYMSHVPFKLTKFINGYLFQDNPLFTTFLRRQPDLESLELHSGKMDVSKSPLSLDHLKTLACSAQFLDTSYSVTRLRLQLNIENSTDNREIDVLGRLLGRNLTRNMNSLAIFFSGDLEPSDFPEIMRVIAVSNIYIHHLEIHQFLPTEVCP